MHMHTVNGGFAYEIEGQGTPPEERGAYDDAHVVAGGRLSIAQC